MLDRRISFPLLAAFLMATPRSDGHTWEDPWFDEAVRGAACIAVGLVEEDTESVSTVRLERILAGDAEVGARVTVWHGDQLPKHDNNQHVRVDESFLFVVRAGVDGTDYRSFTDSYWAFPIDDGVTMMSLRDPFAELRLELDTLAEIVRLVRDPSPSEDDVRALLDAHRAPLEETSPTTDRIEDVTRQILGLEILHRFGRGEPVELAARFFESPYFHVRVSAARALSGVGGDAAVDALAARLEAEDQAAVQSTIGRELARFDLSGPPPALLAFVPRASAGKVPLKRWLMEGRSNELPSPRVAAIVAVMRAEGQEGDWDALAARAEEYWRERPR